jgi:biofilm PGA synthesis N-glycosyltransferase PgaC
MLGSNCVYRRAALVQAGGFKAGALLEDTDLTLRLARAGWQTRFEPQAVSYHAVPTTLTGYWRQHSRWARGFNEAAREQGFTVLLDRRLAWPVRLELLLFALGYLDRLAVAAGSLLLLTGRAKRPLTWLLPVSLLTPVVQTIAALALEHAPAAVWTRLGWLPFFFLLDVAMAATGLWRSLRQSPRRWEERQARQ